LTKLAAFDVLFQIFWWIASMWEGTIGSLRDPSDRNIEELPGTPLQGNYSNE
jgi:hypothetical protein